MRRFVVALLAVIASLGIAPAATAATASTLMLGLNGVSCVSAKFCAAVGSQGDRAHLSKGDVPLTMIWNGTRWRKTATPLPKGWPEGQLFGVSCASAASCVAVGQYTRGGHGNPLAETWNGSVWTATKLPRPAGTFFAVLDGVSCAAARHCTAFVSYFPAPAGKPLFVDTLTGTRWTQHALRPPKGAAFARFGGVSCVSATHCVLAGDQVGTRETLLFDVWNGKVLTPMKVAPHTGSFLVSDVSCATPNRCATIGTTLSPVSGPLGKSSAATWNGRVWSVRVVPGPSGLRNNLSGVSCASAASCVAAGVISKDGREQTSHAAAEIYNGRSWTPAKVPFLANGRTSQFGDVSCLSAKYCVAVGEGGGPNGTVFSAAALTGFWNGRSWKLVTAS